MSKNHGNYDVLVKNVTFFWQHRHTMCVIEYHTCCRPPSLSGPWSRPMEQRRESSMPRKPRPVSTIACYVWCLLAASQAKQHAGFLYKGNILISWRYQLHLASPPTQCLRRRWCTQPQENRKERKIKKTPLWLCNTRNNITITISEDSTRPKNCFNKAIARYSQWG
jgi:hypothetical protein